MDEGNDERSTGATTPRKGAEEDAGTANKRIAGRHRVSQLLITALHCRSSAACVSRIALPSCV